MRSHVVFTDGQRTRQIKSKTIRANLHRLAPKDKGLARSALNGELFDPVFVSDTAIELLQRMEDGQDAQTEAPPKKAKNMAGRTRDIKPNLGTREERIRQVTKEMSR